MKTTIELEMHNLAIIGMCLTFCSENLDKFYERWIAAAKLLGLPIESKEVVMQKLHVVNVFLTTKCSTAIMNEFNKVFKNEVH